MLTLEDLGNKKIEEAGPVQRGKPREASNFEPSMMSGMKLNTQRPN
jgi:hypothetical protein